MAFNKFVVFVTFLATTNAAQTNKHVARSLPYLGYGGHISGLDYSEQSNNDVDPHYSLGSSYNSGSGYSSNAGYSSGSDYGSNLGYDSDSNYGSNIASEPEPNIVTNTVEVVARQPYAVTVGSHVPVPLHVPVNRPYGIEVPIPSAITKNEGASFVVNGHLPYTVRDQVPVVENVEDTVPKPYPIQIARPYTVHMPQAVIVDSKVPVIQFQGKNALESAAFSGNFGEFSGHGASSGDYASQLISSNGLESHGIYSGSHAISSGEYSAKGILSSGYLSSGDYSSHGISSDDHLSGDNLSHGASSDSYLPHGISSNEYSSREISSDDYTPQGISSHELSSGNYLSHAAPSVDYSSLAISSGDYSSHGIDAHQSHGNLADTYPSHGLPSNPQLTYESLPSHSQTKNSVTSHRFTINH